MNYDEITKITAERISDYMTEAVNTDSIAVAEMFHNAAWGARTLWFELVTKIELVDQEGSVSGMGCAHHCLYKL